MAAQLWMKSSCTTCRKAKALLMELGIDIQVRDYHKQPLTVSELESLLPEDPTAFLGDKSPKFRALGLKGKCLSKPEAIALMVEDNNLLKRPILVHGHGVIIGLDEHAYRRLNDSSGL